MPTEEQHCPMADATATQWSGIPNYQYEPPKVGHSVSGVITVQHEVFHQIADMTAFYEALGYDKKAQGITSSTPFRQIFGFTDPDCQ